MKKLFALLLVAGLGASFVGCGGEPAKPEVKPEVTPMETPMESTPVPGDTTPTPPPGEPTPPPAEPAPAEGAKPE